MAGIFDTSVFDYNVFANSLTYKIIKISSTEAVVKILGLIDVTINPSHLVTKQYKKGSIVSGSNVFTLSPGSDAVGLVVGGAVTDLAGISTTVSSIGKREIVLADNMATTANDITLLFDTQIVTANSFLDISKLFFSTTGLTTINVNGQPEYKLSGVDHWRLDNMTCRFAESYPIQVSSNSASSVLVLELKKTGDWGINQNTSGNV